jgi:methyl coenzyme M reductase subunit C
MDGGTQVELPTMIVVVRFPVGGESRTEITIGVESCEPVEDKAAGYAIGIAPGVAFNLHAQ